MRVRGFVTIAATSLVVGLLAGLLFLHDDAPSDTARGTTTASTAPTTTTTIALTSDTVLADALRAASTRLTGRGPSADDISAFTAQYHQDELAHAAAPPAEAAEAYVRLHHPTEVSAYGYVRGAKCFGERLIPGGADADCDQPKAKPKAKPKH
jgi:hypothetical protein